MPETEKLVKYGMIGGVAVFGGYLLYQALQKQGIIRAAQESAERTQTVSTGGNTQTYRPRTTYVLGNSGSVKEINSLPENHWRGRAVTPETWFALAHGSVLPQEQTGTFDGSTELGLTYPEEGPHVSPQIESALYESTLQKTFFGGGTKPAEGTFG